MELALGMSFRESQLKWRCGPWEPRNSRKLICGSHKLAQLVASDAKLRALRDIARKAIA
jgi:hypothetical protein